MEFIVLWIFCAIGIGAWASSWHRSFVTWVFCSIFLSPVIGGAILMMSGKAGKKCSKCAEVVKTEANRCRFCGHEFTEEDKFAQAAGLDGV